MATFDVEAHARELRDQFFVQFNDCRWGCRAPSTRGGGSRLEHGGFARLQPAATEGREVERIGYLQRDVWLLCWFTRWHNTGAVLEEK